MGALVVRVVGIASDVPGVSAGAIDTQPTANAPTTKHDSSDRNTSRTLKLLLNAQIVFRAQSQAAVKWLTEKLGGLARSGLLGQLRGKLFPTDWRQLLPSPRAWRRLTTLNLAIAEHEHVRHLLLLGEPNLVLHSA
jgi:hypothetical protein